jgi:autophagy-related protein 18
MDKQRHSTICELTFHGMVVAVKMNRKRLVVILEETVFIYDISNMKMLHSQLTPINPAGICAISPNSENNYLALPHHQKTPPNPQSQPSHVPKSIVKEAISGDVLLYDLNKMEEVTVIPAHQAPVSCIAINNDGTLMATSSDKGTVIRIFSIPDGKKLFQFRRGSMPARIYSMSFNAASTLLCVSSATETVHIFKLSAPQHNPNNNGSSSLSPPSSPNQATHNPAPWSRDRSVSPSTSEDQSESANLEASDHPSAIRPGPGRPNLMSRARPATFPPRSQKCGSPSEISRGCVFRGALADSR